MNKEEIIKEHPSLCYNCRNSRKPASDTNIEKGYVGCCAPLKMNISSNEDFALLDYFIEKKLNWQLKEAADGWVDLRSNVFGEGSGIITNYQLLTLEVKQCKDFDYE